MAKQIKKKVAKKVAKKVVKKVTKKVTKKTTEKISEDEASLKSFAEEVNEISKKHKNTSYVLIMTSKDGISLSKGKGADIEGGTDIDSQLVLGMELAKRKIINFIERQKSEMPEFMKEILEGK